MKKIETSNKKIIGKKAEDLACTFLKKKGLKILTRNFKTNFGEIDIIAIRKRTLHFIEVRSTTTDFLDTPTESIDFVKQKKIKKVADIFLKSLKGIIYDDVSFDIISVKFGENAKNLIEYLENAF